MTNIYPLYLLFTLIFAPLGPEDSAIQFTPEPAEQALSLSPPPCNCTVTQGSFTSPLPFLSSNSSAVNFYSYGNPLAASSNTGLEESEKMLLMIYEDANTGNTSLMLILDQANDGTGGSAQIEFNCMPGSSFVEFSDDAGELSGSPPTFNSNFNWGPCCTDGGIIGGFGCGNTITINPSIASGISDFSLVFGTPAFPTYVNMPQLNCPITINCGGNACCEGAFEFSAITQDANCETSFDGSIDISTDCATVPTFIWSNGAVTEDLFGVAAGTYSVTITDLNGCSQSETYVINASNPSPEPVITGPTEFCTGDLVELGVGSIYASYQWSNGSSSPSIFVSEPGLYAVTVTSDEGCTGVANTVLTENPVPEPDIMGPSGICIFNDTITLDAGSGYSSYLWSTGDMTQTIDVTMFGGYFVTVTNDFDCSALDFMLVEPLPVPFPEITGPNSVCSGEPIALDVGAGYETYQWSTGENSPVIVTNMGGTYSVTVTNSDNCEGTASLEVVESPADTTMFFSTSCNPADTGVFIQTFTGQYGCDSIEIMTIGLSSSDSVLLFNQSCNPQDTGIYVQNFTNQYGCDSVVIESVTLLSGEEIYFTEYSCNPQDTGIVVQPLTNQFGCDSVVTTTTVLLPSDTVEIFDQSCDPANAGVSEELLINYVGCDSLVITTTVYSLADTTYQTNSTCDPQMAGVFEDLYLGSDGCDSLVITSVNLELSDTTYLEASTCDIGQAGPSEQLFLNQAGCDSLVVTNTIFISADTTYDFASSCNPIDTGVFEEILINSFGCDSFLITTVTLLENDTTALFETSCDPSQSGVEEFLLTNQFGCDSLVVVTTTYAEADSTQVFDSTCEPTQSGTFVEILTSIDGCDSVVTTTVVLLPSDTVEVFAQDCDPSNVGVSEMVFSNQYGCDSLVITTTELLPSDTVFLQTNTCDVNQAGLSQETLLNQYGCDSLVVTTTTFIPPDTTLFFNETCDPTLAGTEEEVLQNMNGCDSILITTTFLLPSDTTNLQAFSCDPGQVGTSEIVIPNSFGCDSLIITNTVLLPTDTTLIIYESCSPADTGLVSNLFSNQYGCDSLVLEQTNLLPAADCELNVLIVGDTIGCDEVEGNMYLTLLDGMIPFDYTWTHQSGAMGSGSLNQIGSPQVIGGLLPGAYTFEILDVDGLSTTLSATIFQPSPLQFDLQAISDFNGFGTSCFDVSDGAAGVEVQSGGLSPYSYVWSNGSQVEEAEGLSNGWTYVTVTGAVGCEAVDSVFLESPGELVVGFEVAHPDCLTEGLGLISVNQVEGGVGPYLFSMNQNTWQDSPLFDGLAPGEYQVEVEDANGCSSSFTSTINSITQIIVNLGQDESIELGDSITLQPIFNLAFSELAAITWGGVDCPGCQSITVGPVATSTYSVTIMDSLGCVASDEMQVLVEKNFDVYIPNAFSPDFNGINDNFTIFGGKHLVKILQLQIFDRWGEAVFTGFNLPPNDLSYGWDGTYRGEELNPAVFVFFTELEFVDGSIQLVEGEVTLIR